MLKRSCYHCNKAHFSFLCFKKSSENIRVEAKIATSNENLNRNNDSRIVVDCSTINKVVSSSVILPTFTCELTNKTQLRCLKDSGAQSCFISEEIADECKLRVLKRGLSLTVNGFNSTNEYKTKIVECEMILQGKIHKIPAVCIPHIRTKLDLPGLQNVAKEFVAKGYSLADKELQYGGDSITNINFIFGTTALYCLPERTIPFGRNCIYSETPIGVMLAGRTDSLLENIKHLKVATNKLETSINTTVNVDKYLNGCLLYTSDAADE